MSHEPPVHRRKLENSLTFGDAAPSQVQGHDTSCFQNRSNEAPVEFRIRAFADHLQRLQISNYAGTQANAPYLVQEEEIQLTEDEENSRKNVEPHRSDLPECNQDDPGHDPKEKKRGARPGDSKSRVGQ